MPRTVVVESSCLGIDTVASEAERTGAGALAVGQIADLGQRTRA